MVIGYLTRQGCLNCGTGMKKYRKGQEEAAYIYQGDYFLIVDKTYISIEHKLLNQVLYCGIIPPNQAKFIELLSRVGLI